MKSFQTIKILFGLSLIACQTQTGWAQLETLGIAAVSPGTSLKQTVDKAGKTLSMGRVLESLDSQLINSFHGTRKFQIIAVSDLKELVKAQERAHSGNYDADDKSLPELFKLAGTKYHVLTSVDDFDDHTETASFGNKNATRRTIRLSAVGKVYNTTTGQLLESVSFSCNTTEAIENRANSTQDGKLADELLVAIAREMAGKIANGVTDVIYPAQVVDMDKTNKQITINRGTGTGIAVGDVWQVFAVGKELFDPRTKKSLGVKKIPIGKAKITMVEAETSTAEVLEGKDDDIKEGAILRLLTPNKTP